MRKIGEKSNVMSLVRIVSVIAVLVASLTTVASADDFSAWSHSQNFYLNTTNLGSNITTRITNFPVCVKLSSSNFSGFSQCLANGADVRFAQNGTTLPIEIEQWDATNSVSELYLR